MDVQWSFRLLSGFEGFAVFDDFMVFVSLLVSLSTTTLLFEVFPTVAQSNSIA